MKMLWINGFRFLRVAALCTLALAILPAWSQTDNRGEGPLDKSRPVGITPEEIIRKFAAKEKEFKAARDRYTYRQAVKVQTLDGGSVTGEYQEVFDVLFNNEGRRVENVVFAPQSSLREVEITMEDLSDIRNRLPFVLTSDEIDEYGILYVGQQQQDDLHTYVFDIAPKVIGKDKRYFQGRVWVDDHDFQIVKTDGKVVGAAKKRGKQEQQFPRFTTWRQQVDGKYWFPVYTLADDTLQFATNDVHIREIVKYTDYKRFGADVKITFDGKDVEKGSEQDEPKQDKPKQDKPNQDKPNQ